MFQFQLEFANAKINKNNLAFLFKHYIILDFQLDLSKKHQ